MDGGRFAENHGDIPWNHIRVEHHAAGVVAADLHETLTQEEGPGRWHISAGPGPAVWKLNTQTGALFYCTRAKSCTLIAER